MGPGDLRNILEGLVPGEHADLLVGMEGNEDAAVYRLTDGQVTLFSADFFTPVVDDPFMWGQIAAANALSDIYAMGGKPVMVLNIALFPCAMAEVFKEVLRGGAAKVVEAGAVVAGGHSVEDKEPKYGLAVVGTAVEGTVLRNSTARAGDRLVLTKPLGFGVLTTALKSGKVNEGDISEAVMMAARLNREASDIAVRLGASAATDVTGFGLAGHLCEMVGSGALSVRVEAEALPIYPRAIDLARVGVAPGGTARNRDFYGAGVRIESQADYLENIMYDPQTSGGLLVALAGDKAEAYVDMMEQQGCFAQVIGEFVERGPVAVEVV